MVSWSTLSSSDSSEASRSSSYCISVFPLTSTSLRKDLYATLVQCHLPDGIRVVILHVLFYVFVFKWFQIMPKRMQLAYDEVTKGAIRDARGNLRTSKRR